MKNGEREKSRRQRGCDRTEHAHCILGVELDLVRANRRTHLARRFADYTVCGIRLDTLGPNDTRVTCPACARFLPPVWQERGSWNHVLGTDSLGRDLLARVIYGARVSLTIGFVSVGLVALALMTVILTKPQKPSYET